MTGDLKTSSKSSDLFVLLLGCLGFILGSCSHGSIEFTQDAPDDVSAEQLQVEPDGGVDRSDAAVAEPVLAEEGAGAIDDVAPTVDEQTAVDETGTANEQQTVDEQTISDEQPTADEPTGQDCNWVDLTECNCTSTPCQGCSGTKQQSDGCGNLQEVACNLPASGCSGVCCGLVCCNTGQSCIQTSCCDQSSVCGSQCCSTNQTCLGGLCCPTSQLCGAICCPDSEGCVCGGCCSTGKVCGEACCGSLQTCVDGACCDNSSLCGSHCCSFPFSGTFFFHQFPESLADLQTYFDSIQEVGMDTVITGHSKILFSSDCNTETPDFGWMYAYYSDELAGRRTDLNKLFEKYDMIFNQAEQRGLKVYVGLVWVVGVCFPPDNSVLLQGAIQAAQDVVEQFWNRYQSKNSLAGWYFGDEPYLKWTGGYYYWEKVTKAVKQKMQQMGFSRPVIISPYIADWANPGNPQGDPDQFSTWASQFFNQTTVDILAVQDSAGGGNTPTYSGAPYTIETFYQKIREKIGKEHLWSDNELFTWCNFQDCWSATDSASATSTSITRLKKQAEWTQLTDVSKRVVWNYDYLMFPQALYKLRTFSNSTRLHDAYLAEYSNTADLLKPVSYEYGVNKPEDHQYVDTNYQELFNGQVANAADFWHTDWVGIVGTAEIILHFGQLREIHWVAVSMMNQTQSGILFPQSLTLYCSQAVTPSWQPAGSWSRPVSRTDSQYLFGNPQKLNSNNICRDLKIVLEQEGPNWTFLDEVEVVGKNPCP